MGAITIDETKILWQGSFLDGYLQIAQSETPLVVNFLMRSNDTDYWGQYEIDSKYTIATNVQIVMNYIDKGYKNFVLKYKNEDIKCGYSTLQ